MPDDATVKGGVCLWVSWLIFVSDSVAAGADFAFGSFGGVGFTSAGSAGVVSVVVLVFLL